jgi:hypothetical protein
MIQNSGVCQRFAFARARSVLMTGLLFDLRKRQQCWPIVLAGRKFCYCGAAKCRSEANDGRETRRASFGGFTPRKLSSGWERVTPEAAGDSVGRASRRQ